MIYTKTGLELYVILRIRRTGMLIRIAMINNDIQDYIMKNGEIF